MQNAKLPPKQLFHSAVQMVSTIKGRTASVNSYSLLLMIILITYLFSSFQTKSHQSEQGFYRFIFIVIILLI